MKLRGRKHTATIDRDSDAAFLDFVSRALPASYGQRFQDLFALWEAGFATEGYFVEFGALNGRDFSNTYLLERLGWDGVVSEPHPAYEELVRKHRTCRVSTKCVLDRTGETVTFHAVKGKPALSTVAGFGTEDSRSRFREQFVAHDVETISLHDLLEESGAPDVVDYLSIDTEGSEVVILSAYDFERRPFRSICVEHNDRHRDELYELLTARGYRRKWHHLSGHDDWYVHTELELPDRAATAQDRLVEALSAVPPFERNLEGRLQLLGSLRGDDGERATSRGTGRAEVDQGLPRLRRDRSLGRKHVGIRRTVSRSLDRLLGPERAADARRAEARARSRMIDLLDVEGERPAPEKRRRKPAAARRAAKPQLTREELIDAHAQQSPEGISHAKADSLPWASPDPIADFPRPSSTRHDFLAGMHEVLRPRTYVEIGVSRGESLKLSRSRSIGVDPAFRITAPIHCDVQILRETSDAFFAMPGAFDHLEGVPVDLAFIDGMHLAEYVVRDFMNMEKRMSRAGVIVIDDMLPRNSLEAYRIRRTMAWTGDVYKVHQVLTTYRPDLTIVPVNTHPTGSYVVVGLDPDSTVLDENYREIELEITGPDPQVVPQDWLERRTAVTAETLLGLDVWKRLVEMRDSDPSPEELAPLWDELKSLPVTR